MNSLFSFRRQEGPQPVLVEGFDEKGKRVVNRKIKWKNALRPSLILGKVIEKNREAGNSELFDVDVDATYFPKNNKAREQNTQEPRLYTLYADYYLAAKVEPPEARDDYPTVPGVENFGVMPGGTLTLLPKEGIVFQGKIHKVVFTVPELPNKK